jgi:caspase domain-containing protein
MGSMNRVMNFAFRLITAAILGLLTQTQSSPAAQLTACHLGENKGSVLSMVTAAAHPPHSPMKTGEPIEVEWSFIPTNIDHCHDPLYLVFSTSSRVRFEGDKFLALPPGPPAPFSVDYARNSTRVLVPLYLGKKYYSGKFFVKVYQAGAFSLDWALVEVPALVSNPEKIQDIAVGQSRDFHGKNLTEGLQIISGNPKIVIRDQFTADKPQKTVLSNSGEFELQVFDRFYRVLDARTSELVLERSGFDPNFSPSSRFIAAFGKGPGFEVIDLYSGSVIATQSDLDKNHGFTGSVHLAAWAYGDAVLALSFWGYGGIEVQQSLTDNSGRHFSDTSCHACQGFATDLALDIRSGTLIAHGQELVWRSIVDSSIGTDAIQKLAFKRIPDQGDDDVSSGAYDKRNKLIEETSDSQLNELMHLGFSSSAELSEGAKDDELSWHLGDKLQLSHHCLWEKDKPGGECQASTADKADAAKEISLRQALRVNHKTISQPVEPYDRLSDARTQRIRSQTTRGISRPELMNTLWDTLHYSLGLDVVDPHETRPAEIKSRIAEKITRSIRSAHEHFRDDVDADNDNVQGSDHEASVTSREWIEEAWNWQSNGHANWLIHSYYSNGASSRYWLYLLRDTGSGDKFVDLSSRLKFKVGSRPSGLDNEGHLEITDERATTYGLGAWPATVDKLKLSFDRYLIASGVWLASELRWALVYDLSTDKIVFFNRDMPSATSVMDYQVTRDGTILVQANVNGELYIYRMDSGAQVLRGFYVDNELVVYDSNGYYVATPEGAQFVFLKFPGQDGYNSLPQFRVILNRPQIIAARLGGKGNSENPDLIAPPEVFIHGDAAQLADHEVSIEASAQAPLSKLRIYYDGQLTEQVIVSAHHQALRLALPKNLHTYWLTVVAVDSNGYESAAKSIALHPGPDAGDRTLFAIAVGTDEYADPKIPRLAYATSDARRFLSAVQGVRGSYYTKVVAMTLYNSSDLRAKLLAVIRNVAAQATSRDTLILYIAGHGLRDTSTGQFFLVSRETRLADLANTAVPWKDIATALRALKGRVVVFLDACQSGSAVDAATNDDAVANLSANGAPFTVLAASKGRQNSIENSTYGGGIFTAALVQALGNRSKVDSNHDGVIEAAELYASTKEMVVKMSKGKQTPWLARNDMVGEVPLF